MGPDELQKAIEACRQCAAAASQCATASLVDKEANAMARCAQLALDTAAICRLVASTAARRAPATAALIRACTELCEELALESERFQALHCRRCIVACRYTAQACRAAEAALGLQPLPAPESAVRPDGRPAIA